VPARKPRKPVAAAATERRRRLLRAGGIGLLAAAACGAIFSIAWGCSGWDPRAPFERNAPEVDDAIEDLDAGRHESAAEVLEKYLGTGACSDAGIGLPDTVRQKPNGSFDLGLALFYLAERYGQRFGDEELGGESAEAERERQAELRSTEIQCALTIVTAIASDASVPLEIRARARYLAGNLEFLRRKYEEAVKQYDQALEMIPGLLEEAGGDGIGRDAAWNRAIALRRIQDQKDAGNDAPDADDSNDAADANDGADGNDGSQGDDGGGDQPDSGGDNNDGGGDDDAGDQDAQPNNQDAAAPPEPQPQPDRPETRDDSRILERLEEAPTYQEEEAKNRARARRGRGMEDK
jgi:tetratricopeptide (TPR) repeat protein